MKEVTFLHKVSLILVQINLTNFEKGEDYWIIPMLSITIIKDGKNRAKKGRMSTLHSTDNTAYRLLSRYIAKSGLYKACILLYLAILNPLEHILPYLEKLP